ncbi:MAG: FkbM family methyltransferase [Ruminococcus sp.]|nr:FkbM family methyltransferase [Ruminococcus sp.]
MELFDSRVSVWDALKNSPQPIVLYGMGDGADKALAAFARYGITAAGVMASDGFVRGQRFHDFRVMTESEAVRRFGDFTVALCFASQLPDVMAHIRAVASRHRTLVPSVPVCGDTLFDEDFIRKYSGDMTRARQLLADSLSRRVFDHVLLFYYTGELPLLEDITTDKDEAFSLLSLGDNEVYVDLGAYNGDTIDEFLHYSGGRYRKIVALEPNDKNFEKLRRHCDGMERVTLWQLGAWSENAILTFNNKAGRNSAIADEGVPTRVAAVDALLCGVHAGYIKSDVEGADAEALLGMKKTLLSKPKLNLAAYHRFEDIFRLPLLVRHLQPEYRIYLRHHPYIPAWDTNLYCQ